MNNLESMKDKIPGLAEMADQVPGGMSGMAGMMASMAGNMGGNVAQNESEPSDDPMEYANMVNSALGMVLPKDGSENPLATLLGDSKPKDDNVKNIKIEDKKKGKKNRK
jgi:hypothetical protein